jgi:hypothetical protein
MGSGAYQQVVTNMMPRRMLHPMFHVWSARMKLRLAEWLQPKVRRWSRWWYSREWRDQVKQSAKKTIAPSEEEREHLNQQEATVEVTSGNAREELLEKLIGEGWAEEKSSQKWDLYQNNEKLLLALEVIGDNHWKLKIRLGTEHRNSSTMAAIVGLAGQC